MSIVVRGVEHERLFGRINHAYMTEFVDEEAVPDQSPVERLSYYNLTRAPSGLPDMMDRA